RAHVDPLPPCRCDLNNRYFPSCDQRGFQLSVPGDVERTGSPPAAGTTHTSEGRRFSAASTVVTGKATRLPSGDIAGELTVVTRCQSAGWKARFCCPVTPAGHSSTTATKMLMRRMVTTPVGIRPLARVGRIA